MSAQLLVDNLMRATGARNHNQLSIITGMRPSQINKIVHGTLRNLELATLQSVSQRTRIKVSTLAGWWAGEP